MRENMITITKSEYDSLVTSRFKYGALLETLADSMAYNKYSCKLQVLDSGVDVAITVKALEPIIYNSLLAKLKKEYEEKEKEENESID